MAVGFDIMNMILDKKTLSVRACLEKAFCKMCVTIRGNDFSDTLWG